MFARHSFSPYFNNYAACEGTLAVLTESALREIRRNLQTIDEIRVLLSL